MLNILSVLRIAIKRLRSNPGLTLSAVAGMVCVLTIIVSVPIFAYAVSGEVLRQQLRERAVETGRALFSVHIHTLQVDPSLFDVDTGNRMAEYLTARFTDLMGLQIDQTVTEIHSPRMGMTPLASEHYDDPGMPLDSMSFLSLELLPAYANIIEGEWPTSEASASGPVQVAIHETVANSLGLNVGERFLMSRDLEVEIAGIWREIDPRDRVWFKEPRAAYSRSLWIPDGTFRERLESSLNNPVSYVSWYILVDEGVLRYQRADRYAWAITRLDQDLQWQAPGIKMDYTPLEELAAFQERVRSLTTLLYAVGAPMAVLALLFIGLTSNIAVQQHAQEVSAMRSRGTSRLQVVTINFLESVLLIAVALPLSLLCGWMAAEAMSDTLSFLEFTSRPSLPLSFEGLNLAALSFAVVIILLARLAPAWGASRRTIIRMKQEQARGLIKPLWRRLYLDVVLLLLGIYAYQVLGGATTPKQLFGQFLTQVEGQGAQRVATTLSETNLALAGLQSAGDPYRDPLLFVAPAIFAIAACMLVLRFVPLVARALAAIVARLPGTWLYLALRQIARRPQDYSSAVLLIMIALSLAIFAASAANTLDNWLSDSIYYSAGTDLVVRETIPELGLASALESSAGLISLEGAAASSDGTARENSTRLTSADLDIEDSAWYPDLQQHLKLTGVKKVTRVGKYQGRFSSGRGETPAWIMGIDRLELPQVAFFRDDFASTSLGALMNALAAEPMGVLLPSQLAIEKGFDLGDRLSMVVEVLDQTYLRDLVVVGTYDFFPTVYPYGTPTLIVNLEYIFGNPDAVIGYDVWLDLNQDADIPLLVGEIADNMAVLVQIRGDAPAAIKRGQDQAERMGLFGVLNIGFLMAGLMAGIGFVLYSYASLRRRFIQLGILQAIGMKVRQLVGYLVSEQLLLMGIAIWGGAVIGLATSYLFVPFLQAGTSPEAQVPPFQVIIGWTEAGWLSFCFAAVLFLTVLGTIAYLARLKVFQAVKLGETL